MCSAYGEWPSRRFGYWDEGQPGGGSLALAFDFAVRVEALEKRREAMERAASGEPAPKKADMRRQLAEMAKNLPEDSPLRGRIDEVLKRGN